MKKHVSLGIDIGPSSVKAVKLSANKTHVDWCGLLEVGSDSDKINAELQKFLSKNKLTGLKAAASVDDASLKIRKIELPKMPDADLKDASRWKMRDVVEGSIEEYIVRTSHLHSDDSKKLSLVGYAIRKTIITKLTQLLDKSGVATSFIEPSSVSLASAIEHVYPSQDRWLAGIDIGASKSTMVIVGNGRFYFSRPLPGLKVSGALENLAGFHQKMAAEVQNTLDTFAVTFQVEQIGKIFLSGGGATIPGLIDYLNTNLGVTTEILNPFLNLKLAQGIEAQIKGKEHLFSQAISLALIPL